MTDSQGITAPDSPEKREYTRPGMQVGIKEEKMADNSA